MSFAMTPDDAMGTPYSKRACIGDPLCEFKKRNEMASLNGAPGNKKSTNTVGGKAMGTNTVGGTSGNSSSASSTSSAKEDAYDKEMAALMKEQLALAKENDARNFALQVGQYNANQTINQNMRERAKKLQGEMRPGATLSGEDFKQYGSSSPDGSSLGGSSVSGSSSGNGWRPSGSPLGVLVNPGFTTQNNARPVAPKPTPRQPAQDNSTLAEILKSFVSR